MSVRPIWSTYWVPGQDSWGYRETPALKRKEEEGRGEEERGGGGKGEVKKSNEE